MVSASCPSFPNNLQVCEILKLRYHGQREIKMGNGALAIRPLVPGAFSCVRHKRIFRITLVHGRGGCQVRVSVTVKAPDGSSSEIELEVYTPCATIPLPPVVRLMP